MVIVLAILLLSYLVINKPRVEIVSTIFILLIYGHQVLRHQGTIIGPLIVLIIIILIIVAGAVSKDVEIRPIRERRLAFIVDKILLPCSIIVLATNIYQNLDIGEIAAGIAAKSHEEDVMSIVTISSVLLFYIIVVLTKKESE